MPATAVKSSWEGGNLVFRDKSGNVITTIDGANRLMPVRNVRTINLPLSSFRELATNDIPAVAIASGGSGIMGKDATPNFEAVNTSTDRALQLQWAASNVDMICTQFALPTDLDDAEAMTLRVYAQKTGTMDTVTFVAAVFFNIGDTDVAPAASGNLANGAPGAITFTLPAADVPAAPGTCTVVLYPGTHGNDTVELFAVSVDYISKGA